MIAFSRTDVGKKRTMNQDCVYESIFRVGQLPNLFLVADGMGGHVAGDLASRETVDTIVQFVSETKETEVMQILGESIDRANIAIRKKASENDELYGMGTTIVAATINDGELTVANVGDSRLYVISTDGKPSIRQITVDHSLVEEMIQRGTLDRKEARNHPDKNIITRAIGAMDYIDIDFFSVKVKDGDIVLMCSDGLSNMIEDEEILEILLQKVSLSEKGEMLISKANDNGGRDNITVLLIDALKEVEA